MLRIALDADAYLLARPPRGVEPAALEAAVRRAADRGRPQLIVWDGALEGGRIRFGDGGLDDLMLAQVDASSCCAVLESAHARIRDAGPGPSAASLAQLARDPRLSVVRDETLVGDLVAEPPGARRLKPAAHPDLISVVVVAHGAAEGVDGFIQALAEQELTSKAEIIVVAAGLAREQARALSDTIDTLALPRPMRIRHFILPGRMAEAVAVGAGLTLATGQAVIVARPQARPSDPQAVQTLANWAAGGDVLSASPRLADDSGRLIAAGLQAEAADASGVTLRTWSEAALSRQVRRVAAPAPWFFAVNRQAWLALGGVRASGEGLWTASLAESGKHLLVGSAGVLWTGRRPGAAEGRAGSLSPDSARAVRWAGAIERAAAPPEVQEALPAATPVLAESGGEAVSFGFSDAFPSRAPLRLLVFADQFGASQSLAFVDGLARARGERRAAVRIVEEKALGADGPAGEAQLGAAIAEHFARTSPTHVVLSRFGHAAATRLVLDTARARGAPVIAHIDDDLFDLPPIIGVERYRTARNPRRLLALHQGLAEADLAMASTPALARKLARLAGHGRIGWMEIGSAGVVHARTSRAEGQSLVIGYMGSASHNHDLEMIAPALNAVLEGYDHVSVELFGSIGRQPAAELLRGRVRRHRAVSGDYQGFKAALAGMGWDIGLAPLRPIAYNRYKTPTKWVEYAEAGVAAVVSDCEPYRPMIRADAALPAGPDQWQAALRRLIEEPALRAGLVSAADRLLRSSYGWARLESGMLALLERAAAPALAA
jgi:hypothetical protein